MNARAVLPQFMDVVHRKGLRINADSCLVNPLEQT
jgi:hypothetical protein